jgi:SAM-dependent methyltransferase/tetratricopeptide (TPR) repeat protein
MSQPSNTSASTADSFFRTAQKHLKKENLVEAEKSISEAIALDEGNAEYWVTLGVIWGKMNRHNEAVEANRMATTLKPDSADAHHNLGLSLIAIGADSEGLAQLDKSFQMLPTDELALNLATLYYTMNDFKKSAFYHLHIYKTKKLAMPETQLYQLAYALFQNGDLSLSLSIMISLVKRFPNKENYINLLIDLYRRVPHGKFDQDAKDLLENLLKQKNVRFLFLRNPWTSLFILDPAYLELRKFIYDDTNRPDKINEKELFKSLKSDFLCLGLQKGLAVSIPIENIFTNVRKYLLTNWKNSETWPDTCLKFICSLAINCWYNDYVYYETQEEKKLYQELHSFILSQKKPFDKTKVEELTRLTALLSCYIPLCEAFKTLDDIPQTKKFQTDLKPLLLAQFEYPRIERELIPTIPDFCEIEDKTSLSVQDMYAARPYPRWISTSFLNPSESIADKSKGLQVLVAGCGTGHEPALYCSSLPHAKVTAVDLSLPSIAYGKRKAIELGIDKQIEFLHGDLMKVGELNKKFDFIASSGVLHHLKEPEKGLKAILSTLQDNGRLSISLYSKYARDYTLKPASNYIIEKKYSSSDDDIRQFRRDVMFMTSDNPITRCASAGDFFFLSECNDLLFHVQEHRYTPTMIWEMAERHDLVPFYIAMTTDRLKSFQEIFADQSPLNPELLEKFEEKNPKAFIEMFKVFFHRKGEEQEHPIDFLIKAGIL